MYIASYCSKPSDRRVVTFERDSVAVGTTTRDTSAGQPLRRLFRRVHPI
jgi:hypothetical protein